jgi:uroporphyrinogen decarboxylase
MRKALTREQVKMVIERTGCEGVPNMLIKWWGDGLAEKYGDDLYRMAEKYPEDICLVWYQEPGYAVSPNSNPEYRFGYKTDYSNAEHHSIGHSVVLLPDWEELDQFLAHFPDPNEAGNFNGIEEQVRYADGRYVAGGWWRLFHERFWSIRGMENLMLDYYDNMEGLKIIGKRLIEFYKIIIDRYSFAGCDAIFSSDDLGHQHGPMMSPTIFHELYYPLYKELIDYIHSKGMKFFLHSCGDNSLLMEDLIEAGVDVFHPVQKWCMDMQETADKYGDRMTFLVGMDVQHILVEEKPEQVRQEIRQLKSIFNRPEGGLILAMGNGILPDTPLENIEAALDEICK